VTSDIGEYEAHGNCLCHAFYEACGKAELLPKDGKREAIIVRNLRRHIIEAQVNELRQRCENIPQTTRGTLEVQRQNARSAIGRILDRDIQTSSEIYGNQFDKNPF
jgi:hypothetical protein